MGKIANVIGVLHYNDETREELLRRVYWGDTRYTSLGGDFVKYAELKDRLPSSPTNGLGILAHTFDRGKEYGREMARRYLSNGIENRTVYYNDNSERDDERWKWEGDYFFNFTLDNELSHVADDKFIEEGAINVRSNDDRFLEYKYITPALIRFYGSSPGLNTKMFKYTFGQYYTGRILDIDEANVRVENDYLNYLFTDKFGNSISSVSALTEWNTEAPKRHMFNMFKDAEKITGKDYFDAKQRYVDFIQANNSGITKERGIIANIDEFTENTFKASEVLNTRYKSSRGYQVNFNEGDYDGGSDTINTEFSNFYYNEPKNKPKSLLSKTNDLFKKHKISSLAARFHTSAEIDREPDVTDTAKTPLYGNSHGRNLLKKNHIDQKTNGYEDPYCRVWTYHHQYDTVNKMIRPFDEGVAGEDFDTVVHPYISKPNSGTTDGFKYLRENSVLGENGFVTIAPKGDPCGNLKVEIKKCMFSIENLAWKDVPRNQGYISKEQRGPNGGRIMWFPPYDLDFNENVSVNWNQSNFIGRGESVYTYTNTSRQGTLSFAILIDHPSIVDNIPKHNLNNVDTDSDGGTVDLEADVLRFFAGCQVPALSRKTDCPDSGPSPSPNPDNGKPDTVEPKNEIPKMEKGKHVKFYVYYPNNYSGNGQKMTKSQWAVGGSSDRRWFDYLACGKDTKIVPGGPGYEWNNGAGVSIYNSSYTAKDANFDGNQTDNEKPGQMEVYEKGSYAAWKIVDPKYKLNNVWYQYRVDFDLHQKLYNRLPGQKLYTRGMQENKSNYYDYKNFKLNWELTNVPEDATHSFAEIIAAIMLAFPNSFRENYITDLDFRPYIKQNNEGAFVPGTKSVEELMNAFKNHEFVAAVTEGGATKQDPINSEMLAIRRERSVKDLIIQEGEVDESCFVDSKRVFQDNLEEMTTVNTLEAKRQRYAAVELWYGVPEVQKLSEMVHNTAGNDEQVEENLDAILAARRSIAGVQNSENEGNSESTSVSEAVALATEGKNMTSRYETEAEYFKEIQRTDPLVYNNIITKFKYFSPAYHSISPEGFNARLTFLQQCTRQGHTISATDLNFAKTAGNLSFGRMPVCVLRIGDFINTKILINSMSINYGANGVPQWDMNPEGIGVQPMYAKVQMGITILGGQSLSGPINRLQNAVSFNYYANTGVYDDRSDRINMKTFAKKFDKNGEFVREETVETSSDKIRVYDESEYGITKTTYEHLWSPTPNLSVKDDNNNKIASYNEFMEAGGTKGMVRTPDGKYVMPNK